MKKLEFYNNQALTPFGSYRITHLEAEDRAILWFPDKTCRTFLSVATATYYAKAHWISTLASCLETPLLTLFSTPGFWKRGTRDRFYTLYQLSDTFSLCEGIAVCYPNQQKEIQSLIKEEIEEKTITEFSDKGRTKIVALLTKLVL